MANVYKGLTVQFGGDTTDLQKALKQATSAASDTQSQLRKLNNALTFDDDNVVALKQRFTLLGDAIGDASSKLEVYRTTFDQLGDQVVTLNGQTTTIRELADETENIGLAASEALDAYNNLDAKLEQVNSYLDTLRTTTAHVDDEWEIWSKSVKDMDYSEVEQLVEYLEKHNVLAEAAGDAILVLKGSYQEIANNNAVYKQVLQFENLQTSIADTEGQVERLTAQLTKMGTESVADLATDFSESVAHIESVTAAIEKGSTSIDEYASIVQKLNARLESSSDDLDLNERKLESLSLQYDATSEKAEALFTAMGFSSDQYDGLDKATSAVVDYQLEVEQGTLSVEDLKSAIGLTDSEAEDMSATLTALAKTTTQLHTEVEDAAQAYAEAKSRVDSLTQEYEQQQNELRSYLTQLGLSGDAVDEFCSTQGSLRDRLIAGLEAMDLASTGIDQYGQLVDLTVRDLEGLIRYVSDYTTEQTEATNAMRAAIDAGEDIKWSDYNASLLDTTHNTDDLVGVLDEIEAKIGDATDELREAESALANSKVAEEIGKTRDEIVDLTDDMAGLSEESQRAESDLLAAYDDGYSKLIADNQDIFKSTEEQQQAVEALAAKYEDWGSRADTAINGANSLLDEMESELDSELVASFTRAEQAIDDAFNADYSRDFISEMNNVDSAVQSLQTELSKVDAALQFDPTNPELLNTKMELLEETTRALEVEIDSTEAAFTNLGNTSVKLDGMDTTVADLAEQTSDAAVDAAKAESEYTELTTRLQAMCDPITEATHLTGELDDSFDLFATMGTESTTEIINKLQELEYITEDQAQQLQDTADAWASAKEKMDATEQVQQYKQLGTQLQTLKADASDAADQLAQMRVDETLSSDVSDVSGQVEILDSRLEETRSSLTRVEEKLKLDPSNVELSAEKTRLLQQYTDTASEKMGLLSDRMGALESSGIESSRKSMMELEQDVDDATTGFRECTAKVEELQAELDVAEQRARDLAESTDGMEDDYEETAKEVGDLEAALDDARQAQEDAADALKDAQMAKEYRELTEELQDTEDALQDVGTAAEKASSKVETTASKTTSSTQGTLYAIQNMGSEMEQLGSQLQSVFESALESANEVSEAFVNMKKTTEGTEEEFEELYDAAQEISLESAISADDILEIEAVGGALGLAADELESFAEAIGNLSISTDLEAEEAAEEIGSLMNILQDFNTSNIDEFSDALVRLGNNGASTESEIVDIAERIASVGSQAGMSTPEILAWASTIASTGVNAESAGTAISNTMSDIESAVDNGGETLELFAEIAGVSADEFAQAWEEDASGAFQDFIIGLSNMEDGGESTIVALEELGISSVRQVTNIENLASSISLLDDNLTMSEDAWNGVSDEWGDAGDAANEAEQATEGLSGTITILQNTIEVLSTKVGEALQPMLEDLVGWLQEFVGNIDESDYALIQMAAKVTVVSVAGGALIEILSSLVNGVKAIGTVGTTVVSSLSKLGSSITELVTGTTAATTATATLSSTLTGGLVGVGIVATIAGIASLVETYMTWNEQIDQAKESSEELKEADEDLAKAVRNTSDAMDDETDAADELYESVGDVNEYTEDLIESTEELEDALEENWSNMFDVIDEIPDYQQILEDYTGAFDENGEAVELTNDQISDLYEAVEFYNEVLGTSYTVMQDADGAFYVVEEGADDAEGSIDDFKVSIEELADEAFWEEIKSTLATNMQEISDEISETEVAQIEIAFDKNEIEDEFDDLEETCLVESDGLNNKLIAFWTGVDITEVTDEYKQTLSDQAADLLETFEEDGYTFVDEGNWVVLEQLESAGILEEGTVEALHNIEQEWGTLEESETANAEHLAELAEDYDWSEEFLEIVQKACDEGDTIVQDFILGLDDKAEDVSQNLQSKSDTGTEDFAHALDECGISVESFTSLSEDEMADMVDSWDGDMDSVGDLWDDTLDGVSEDFGLTLANMGLTEQEEAAVLQALIDGDLDTVEEIVSKHGYELPTVLSSAINENSYLVDDAAENMLDGLTAEMGYDEVSEVTSKWGIDFDTSLASAIEANGGTPSTAAQNVLDDVLANLDTSEISTLTDKYGFSIGEGLANAINGNADLAGEASASLSDTVQDSFTTPMGIHSPSTVMIEYGQDIIDGLVMGLSANSEATTAMATLAQSLISTFSVSMTTLNLAMYSYGTEAGTHFASGISDSSGTVTGAISLLLTASTANLGAAFQNSMSSKGEAGVGAFIDAINDGQKDAKTAGEALGKKVWNGGLGSDFRDDMEDAGKKGAQNFINGVKNDEKLTAAKEAGEKLATKAYNGAKSKNGDVNKEGYAYYAGVMFATGFGNGIDDTSSWVYDIAYDLAEQAVKAANDAQDSGSPSKAMRQVGQWYGEGYAEGIASEYDEIERVAAQAAAVAIEAASTDAVASINYETTAQAATASAVLEALDRLDVNTSKTESVGTVVNQTFKTKVVRSDSDLYTAAPIIYRNAMREAARV